jgi:hypothetical protein
VRIILQSIRPPALEVSLTRPRRFYGQCPRVLGVEVAPPYVYSLLTRAQGCGSFARRDLRGYSNYHALAHRAVVQ